jgi:hypothetical protein
LQPPENANAAQTEGLVTESTAGSEPHFGECADCGCALERPFWDTICFTCQDERDNPADEWEDE